MISLYPLIAILLCSSALQAMDEDGGNTNNNNNNNLYKLPIILDDAPSAPPAYDSDDDRSQDTEHEDQIIKYRAQFKASLQALKERRAAMKKDHMMLHIAFKNKSGSEFLSKSMSYDINDDGTCPPTDGWEVVSFENANGLSHNPLPLNYENPLANETIQAFGWVNFQRRMVERRVYSRVSEEQKEREKAVYTTNFIPTQISLEQRMVTVLVSLSKIVDGQDELVVPKTKCTVPLYQKYQEPYKQEFQPADTEPITLAITTGIYGR
jgi:hypothetical protein